MSNHTKLPSDALKRQAEVDELKGKINVEELPLKLQAIFNEYFAEIIIGGCQIRASIKALDDIQDALGFSLQDYKNYLQVEAKK